MAYKLSMTSPSPSLFTTSMEASSAAMGFQLSRLRCKVHPSVIMTMLDAHCRLYETNGFAIGTLLGTVTTDGTAKGSGSVVEILDCFANSFHWDTTTTGLTIQKEPHEWMLKLREKVNPKLVIVGWCCTTSKVLITTALSDWVQSEQKISRFTPSRALPEPVHILIDASLDKQQSILAGTKAYIRGPLKQLFHEVSLEIALNPSDVAGAAGIIKSSAELGDTGKTNAHSVLDGSQSSLIVSLQKLSKLITRCLEYTQAVTAGELEGDPETGRQLLRAIGIETLLPRHEVENMLQGSIKDNLMVAALVNLARLQFAAAERLNTSFG